MKDLNATPPPSPQTNKQTRDQENPQILFIFLDFALVGFQYKGDQRKGWSNTIQNTSNLQWQANGNNLKQDWKLIQQNTLVQQFFMAVTS